MPYTITNDRLDGVEQIATPNMGGAFKKLRFLVMHYTAGLHAASAITQFKDPSAQVSAHLVIGRDSTPVQSVGVVDTAITQVVPFNRQAWHAGASSWKPKGSLLALKGLNAYAIGIEIVNWGPLRYQPHQNIFTAWTGHPVPNDEVVEVDPNMPGAFHIKHWHKYPAAQLARVQDVARTIVWQYKLEDIIGHSDIAPGRKTDPGPAFPTSNIRSAIFGRNC